MKKIIFLMVSLVVVCISQTVFAGLHDYNHAFINIGTGGYYVDNPRLEVGTRSISPERDTTSPLAKIKVSHFTPAYSLSGGYQFCNCSQSWLTKIFGHLNSVLFRLNYWKVNRTQRPGDLGFGKMWFIDGRQFSPVGEATNIYGANLTDKHKVFSSGIYYSGLMYTTNPKVTLNPSVGLVFSRVKDTYNYNVSYNSSTSQHEVRTDLENYRVRSNYYGLAFGEQINYLLLRNVSLFTAIEGQLLHVRARLNAHQEVIVTDGQPSSPITKNVKDSQSKPITYRAIVMAGASYQFSPSFYNMKVSFKAGLDRWGYKARIVPPNHDGDGPVHLTALPKNDYFSLLELHIPFA